MPDRSPIRPGAGGGTRRKTGGKFGQDRRLVRATRGQPPVGFSVAGCGEKRSPEGAPGTSFLPCNTHVACYIEQLVAGARPASVAQLVEPRFCKPVVVGSSPSASFGTSQAIFAPSRPPFSIGLVIVQGGSTQRTGDRFAGSWFGIALRRSRRLLGEFPSGQRGQTVNLVA